MDKNWTTWNTQAMQALDRGDIAQAERAFRQACPLRVVSAMQTGNDRGTNSLAQCPQICHCEAPTGPRRPEREARGSALGVQSREGSHDFADSLPVIRLGTARLPRRFAPRNDTSGSAAVHQCPSAVELPCTRRSLSAAAFFSRTADLYGSPQPTEKYPKFGNKGQNCPFLCHKNMPFFTTCQALFF